MAKDRVESEAYRKVVSGFVEGSAGIVQLPDVPCKLAWIVAEAANAGNIYLGPSTVKSASTSTDPLVGFQLDAGVMIGPLPIANLNQLYHICDNPGDDLMYFVLE